MHTLRSIESRGFNPFKHRYICLHVHVLVLYSSSFVVVYSVRRTEWVRIRGTMYSIGAVVLTKFINDMPIFGRIVNILLSESMKPLLVTDVLQTICFNKHSMHMR